MWAPVLWWRLRRPHFIRVGERKCTCGGRHGVLERFALVLVPVLRRKMRVTSAPSAATASADASIGPAVSVSDGDSLRMSKSSGVRSMLRLREDVGVGPPCVAYRLWLAGSWHESSLCQCHSADSRWDGRLPSSAGVLRRCPHRRRSVLVVAIAPLPGRRERLLHASSKLPEFPATPVPCLALLAGMDIYTLLPTMTTSSLPPCLLPHLGLGSTPHPRWRITMMQLDEPARVHPRRRAVPSRSLQRQVSYLGCPPQWVL